MNPQSDLDNLRREIDEAAQDIVEFMQDSFKQFLEAISQRNNRFGAADVETLNNWKERIEETVKQNDDLLSKAPAEEKPSLDQQKYWQTRRR